MRRRRPRVLILGAGLAAVAAAKLLHDRGFEIIVAGHLRSSGRIVAISAETLALASDLFGVDAARPQIGIGVSERRVRWSGEATDSVPQPALVCDAGEFAMQLARPLPKAGVKFDAAGEEDADWILDASGRPHGAAVAGGERLGQFLHIANVRTEACTTIIATQHGWIFTAPHPLGGLTALLVTPSALPAITTPGEAAARLALAGMDVETCDIIAIAPPANIAPALSMSLFTANRLRIGDAALALDPLRGDGTGYALRGALLAQAFVAAVEGGRALALCLAHYEQRLRQVFLSHLAGCAAHYRTARHSEIWSGEIAAMERLHGQLNAPVPVPALRLEGRDLVSAP